MMVKVVIDRGEWVKHAYGDRNDCDVHSVPAL